MVLAFLMIIGFILGSFFNVAGLRIPLKKSIIAPRSACPACHHQLTPIELIPIISYLFQAGKCRHCHVQIPLIYPFVELTTGLLFVIAPIMLGWSSELLLAWTLTSLFMIIFVSDITYMIIPDKVLLIFSVIFLAERIFIPLNPWWDMLLGAAAGFLLPLIIALISKGGIGGGDIKLFALIGFALGLKTVILSLFLAALYGTLFGIIGLIGKKLNKRNPIPFGPFIAAGTLTAYYYGEIVLGYYFTVLLLEI